VQVAYLAPLAALVVAMVVGKLRERRERLAHGEEAPPGHDADAPDAGERRIGD
jgi:hypothetical protein